MPDFDAIAQALADRFDPGVTTPAAPAGLTDIRSSTADLPNAAPRCPAVLVFTDRGEFPGDGGGHQTRIGVTTFRVQFLLRQGVDLARDESQLRRWLTVLVDRLKVSVTLGGLVSRCAIIGWTLGIIRYAGKAFSGIELTVMAVTSEAWAAT